ncbi:XdhC family protein [Sphingopyxis sp.]|uniref:XdhC family protein n=1 Tax=Sphingopyxis sp. TaxID=1908224 RepID=UPI002D76D354|nr:XdhC family protein [Sphingopyxis sp.]HET6526896.1 XdhC family protein [Sphingopyxis sp.]
MTGLATSSLDILHFLRRGSESGDACVLVTLTGIEGTSPRALGAQMAIAANGDYAGSLSSGCIEAAVVAEALDALAAGVPRLVRFGLGSPYLDIRLPCGGGIDLLFTPRPDRAAIEAAIALLDRRKPAALALAPTGLSLTDALAPTGWRGDNFVVTYVPQLRILAFGQGEELTAAAALAAASGATTAAFSPYARDIAALRAAGVDAELLPYRSWRPGIASDPWTAFLFLFHDRDWEEELIPWALEQSRFYVGALGSRRTHADRKIMLEAADVAAEAIGSLRSPVGLIPSTRDPATLAISALAEIAEQFATDALLPLASGYSRQVPTM